MSPFTIQVWINYLGKLYTKQAHLLLWIDSSCGEGPSLTCFLFVSPAVGLQIFWMGVSVASAPPQTLPPRWKGCRPPPVTRPSRRFRTSPLSDRHGHHRRTGPLLRPFSTHFTFVPNSFPKWLSFFSWIVLLRYILKRGVSFPCGTDLRAWRDCGCFLHQLL